MKRILPILFAALALAQQATATNVSGILYGSNTWTKTNSPYIVSAHLLVDEGASLIVEPGVEVRVDSGVNFYVDGSLRAIGTQADPIIFTHNPTASGFKKMEWPGMPAWQQRCRQYYL